MLSMLISTTKVQWYETSLIKTDLEYNILLSLYHRKQTIVFFEENSLAILYD